MRLPALFLTLVVAACAEERVVPLSNPLGPTDAQEMATILRTVLQLKDVTIKEDPNVRVGGPDADLEASEWLIRRLDRPRAWRPSEQEVENPATRDYHGSVRVYYLPADTSQQSMQETLTILRMVLQVRKVFNYTPQKALVVADSRAQLEAIEWLLGAMAGSVPSAPYRLAGKPDDMVRVFALLRNTGATEIADLTKDLRGRLNIQRVFNRTNPTLMVVRGRAVELDAAEKAMAAFR